jgi:predicted helicase
VYSIYRPFIKKFVYFDKIIVNATCQFFDIFPNKYTKNFCIVFRYGVRQDFSTFITSNIVNLDLFIPDATQCLPLYVYDKEGNRHDNITDWALNQFKNHYGVSNHDLTLQKLDIFHYVYAVLHNPAYREKYELNLKREFPRTPYYENFAQWADWGKKLMELHLNYETVKQYPLERHDLENAKIPKAKLKADKENGLIILDDNTHLSGVPVQAWEYKLGNRSALEWILDQYKEKKPKDPTIAEKFNHYKFADYKEQVIELLMRVCTVSIETMAIIETMKKSGEHNENA